VQCGDERCKDSGLDGAAHSSLARRRAGLSPARVLSPPRPPRAPPPRAPLVVEMATAASATAAAAITTVKTIAAGGGGAIAGAGLRGLSAAKVVLEGLPEAHQEHVCQVVDEGRKEAQHVPRPRVQPPHQARW